MIIVRKFLLFLLIVTYVSAVKQMLVKDMLLSKSEGGNNLIGNISSMIEDGSLASQFENADPKAIAQVIGILKGLIVVANKEIAKLNDNIAKALVAKINAKKLHDIAVTKLGEAKTAEYKARLVYIKATAHHAEQVKIHKEKQPGLSREAATLQNAINILQPLGVGSRKIPTAGLVAWYKLGTAAKSWANGGGANSGAKGKGTGTMVVKNEKGAGATKSVQYLYGDVRSRYSFGSVLTKGFTVCSITRYTGSSRGRILSQCSGANWLHGHWAGYTGVGHYNGWVTHPYRNRNNMNWIVMCGNRARRVFVNGKNVSNNGVGGALPRTMGLDIGCENSHWGVAEVATWNRWLSVAEMKDVSKTMMDAIGMK